MTLRPLSRVNSWVGWGVQSLACSSVNPSLHPCETFRTVTMSQEQINKPLQMCCVLRNSRDARQTTGLPVRFTQQVFQRGAAITSSTHARISARDRYGRCPVARASSWSAWKETVSHLLGSKNNAGLRVVQVWQPLGSLLAIHRQALKLNNSVIPANLPLGICGLLSFAAL